MNLANAYSKRIRGDLRKNLERAIEGYEAALEVLTREALPVQWAGVQMNLATAYRRRIGGDPGENLERAIQGYRAALKVLTREAPMQRRVDAGRTDLRQCGRVGHWPVPAPTTSSAWRPARSLVIRGECKPLLINTRRNSKL